MSKKKFLGSKRTFEESYNYAFLCISWHLAGKVYLEANTVHLLPVCCMPLTRVEVEKVMQTDFTRATGLIIWNRRFMSFLGLWPCKINQPVFLLVTTYMIIHCSMAVSHLKKHAGHLDLIVENLNDNVLFTMILGKMFICRWKYKIIAEFLQSIEIDFSIEMYDTVREKMAYLNYNELAIFCVKFFPFVTGFTSVVYYLRKFFENWNTLGTGNFTYILPYPVHPFFEIEDTPTYICICLYLVIAIPIVTCGYAGIDGFVLSLALHICGQFAALSCKIDNLLKDRKNCHHHVRNIVLRHRHLITLAKILENTFNIICLQQTLGTLLLLCFTVYHMITTSEHSENINTMAFILYIICVLTTILGYCYTGECLITESIGLRDAFYNSDWYNHPPSYTKLINICMVRTEKPLMLTAGKFVMLSLNTFTSIVKTSMAYMSVLRNFI